MADFDVAHINQRGVELIIIPLQDAFGQKTQSEQQQTIRALQFGATSAGLRGTVVPVWDDGFGRMAFIAQRNWHPFFQSINLDFVAANINRRLTIN